MSTPQSAASGASSGTESHRGRYYRSVDYFRGAAVLLMVETHLLNTMLRPDLQTGVPYRLVDFINGLVAPAFLFTAGLVLALTIAGEGAQASARRTDVRRWGRQIVIIWALGYLLRAPGLTPGTWAHATSQDWQTFFIVDVLHCIAASWLLLLIIHAAVRRAVFARALEVGLWIGIVMLTPLLWSSAVDAWLPIPIANYFTEVHGSLFPITPWGAYVITGALAGHVLRRANRSGCERLVMGLVGLFTAGAGLSLGWLAFHGHRLTPRIPWPADPMTVIARAALVVAALTAFYFATELPRGSSQPSWIGARLLQIIGQESLFVYVVHLLILFRIALGGGTLASAFRDMLGWQVLFLVLLAMIAGVTALALAWQAAKRRGPTHRRAMIAAIAVVVVLL